MATMRRWLSGVLARWCLKTHPDSKAWVKRWGPEGFMVVPRSWVREEMIEADREWRETDGRLV